MHFLALNEKINLEKQATWLLHRVMNQPQSSAHREMNRLPRCLLQGHFHLQTFGSAEETIDSVGFLCSCLSLRLVALIKTGTLLKLLGGLFSLLWNVESFYCSLRLANVL